MDALISAADPAITGKYWIYAGVIFVITFIAAMFMRKRYQWRLIQGIAIPCLVTYIFLVLASTVLCRRVTVGYEYELKPFWSYVEIMHGNRFLFYEDLLNCMLLLPVGILMPMVAGCKAKKTALTGFVISLMVEFQPKHFKNKKGIWQERSVWFDHVGSREIPDTFCGMKEVCVMIYSCKNMSCALL